jgi:hypothetical protein
MLKATKADYANNASSFIFSNGEKLTSGVSRNSYITSSFEFLKAL